MEDGQARTRRSERLIAGLFGVGALGGLAACATYAFGGQTQLEGLCFAVAFGGLGAGFVVWAHRLLDVEDVEQPWPFAPEHRPAEREHAEALRDEVDHRGVLHQRPLLRRSLLGAMAALGLAALFPIRSLGPRPGNSLRTTPWRSGRRLVDAEGRPIVADQLPVGGLVTVFPEGHLDAADAVAVAVRVGSDPAAGDARALTGLYVYSKVCTHAGCPVGLYVDERRTLLCPCHQSEFDVLDGARPMSGPADRALPRLQVRIGDDGELVAEGDFDDPPGPGWWTL